jgi:hydroxypyruvate isomerase
VVERVRATGPENLGLLFDTFHLTTSGDDLGAVITEHAGAIAHVQVADAPGRAEPGTGTVDVPGTVAALWAAGYRGAVAAEYKPSGPTEESLGWIAGVPRLEQLG